MRSTLKYDIMPWYYSVESVKMKTKIIYISGGEVFDAASVRAAMDNVRAALGLGTDTVLFGVPVDADDANICGDAVCADDLCTPAPAPEIPAVEQIAPEPIAAPAPKRARKKKDASADKGSGASAPILSVIGAIQGETAIAADDAVVPNEDLSAQSPIVDIREEIMFDDDDDAPKSIEDIFEDLAPLAEDKVVDLTKYDESADEQADVSPVSSAEGDFDATLSHLAVEFAENQLDDQSAAAKGGVATRSAEGAKGGRIGKLKNILPFKKKENRESSVLGDLFGWAGVAANDDAADFSMPDFFQANG